MGLRSPSRHHPRSSPPTSRSEAPLLGFVCPFNARGRESPRPDQLPGRASPVGPGIRRRVPTRRLRCRSQAFPAPQRPCSSLRRPAIFRRVAFLGFRTPGIYSNHKAPTTRRRRRALLTLLPSDWPIPRPRRGSPRAHLPVPRSVRPMPLFAFRAFVFVEVDLRHQVTINVPVTDPSLLCFRLLMGLHLRRQARLPPRDRHASRAPGPSPDQAPAALHGLLPTKADPLSREDPPIPRFLAFDRLSR